MPGIYKYFVQSFKDYKDRGICPVKEVENFCNLCLKELDSTSHFHQFVIESSRTYYPLHLNSCAECVNRAYHILQLMRYYPQYIEHIDDKTTLYLIPNSNYGWFSSERAEHFEHTHFLAHMYMIRDLREILDQKVPIELSVNILEWTYDPNVSEPIPEELPASPARNNLRWPNFWYRCARLPYTNVSYMDYSYEEKYEYEWHIPGIAYLAVHGVGEPYLMRKKFKTFDPGYEKILEHKYIGNGRTQGWGVSCNNDGTVNLHKINP